MPSATGRRRRRSAAPRSRRQFEPFARAAVAAIGAPECEAFVEYQIAARGHHMALASRAVLVQAFRFGRTSTHWRLKDNPAAGLSFERPDGRIEIISFEEFNALVAAADAMDRASIGDALYLGLFTGQRQTDRLAMKDEGQVDGRRMFRQSKTGALVPIKDAPALAARLAAAKARVAAIKLAIGTRPETIVVDETTGREYNEHTYRHVFADVRALAARIERARAGAVSIGCRQARSGHSGHVRHDAVPRRLRRAGDLRHHRPQLQERATDQEALSRPRRAARRRRDRQAGGTMGAGREGELSEKSHA
jgi:hypothetical protein